jgi:hypothetical protein
MKMFFAKCFKILFDFFCFLHHKYKKRKCQENLNEEESKTSINEDAQ